MCKSGLFGQRVGASDTSERTVRCATRRSFSSFRHRVGGLLHVLSGAVAGVDAAAAAVALGIGANDLP
jgi:predicted dinucleotide-utilizing enzyme